MNIKIKGPVLILALVILIVGSGSKMAWTEIVTNQVPWNLYTDSRAINNAQEIWNFFRGNNFTEEATAGILGNTSQESFNNPGQIGLNYSTTNPYTPRGLLMWTTQTNIDRLYSYTGASTWMQGSRQCAYILDNPNDWVFFPNSSQGYTYTWAQYAQLTDIYEATKAFCWEAERPGSPQMNKRTGYAAYWYEQFTGTIPPDPPPPPPPPGNSDFLLMAGRDIMRRTYFKH